MFVTNNKAVIDGTLSVPFGMNDSTDPRDLSEKQYAGARNLICRGGIPRPRPGFRLLRNDNAFGVDANEIIDTGALKPWYTNNDTTGQITTSLVANPYCYAFQSGAIQGTQTYTWGEEAYAFVVVSGIIYRIYIVGQYYELEPVDIGGNIGPFLDQSAPIYTVQADRYVVFQDGLGQPLIWNGNELRYADNSVSGKPEVPIGTAMFFSNGRLWVANGQNLYVGDILGGPTSVITFSENLYMSGGTSFTFPHKITGLAAAPKLDSATGFGELIVGCEHSMHTVNAEVTDRTQWSSSSMQHVLYPAIGCSSHFSFTVVATDVYWRYKDTIRSFRNSKSGVRSE